MPKPRLLFYLKPEVLEVYSDQTEGAARLDFPSQVVKHQEIFEAEKYSQILNEFFSQMGISGLEGVVLISAPLIYSQEFAFEQSVSTQDPNKPLLDYNALNSQIESFIEAAPFDNNQIAKLELKGEASSLVLVTSQALFKPIVDEAVKLGGKILAVVPITLFGDLTQKTSLTPDDVDLIFADRKNLQKTNFVTSQLVNPTTKTTTVETPDDEDDEVESKTKSKFLLVFGALFILGGMLVLGVMLNIITNPIKKSTPVQISQEIQTSPFPTPVVTVATESAIQVGTPSAALQEVKNAGLKVNVINGSGITGQGSKVKGVLSNLGYKDINIGGTSLSGSTNTNVNFDSKVTSASRNELVNELGKIFLTVKPQDASPSAKYDIEVTTGAYK